MKYSYILFLFIIFSSISLGYSQDSLNIKKLHHWENSSIKEGSWLGGAYNETWGFVHNNREYAVIGSTRGTHIFDITDSLVEVAEIIGKDTGSHIIHRDFHDYAGYLYGVSDEGLSSLQIIDLHYLPDSAPLIYNQDTLFRHAHNIFIDSSNAKMYVCGGDSKYDVYSLDNPVAPVRLNKCHIQVPWWNNTIGYVHDTYVRDNIAYCNSENRGLFIVDFTDVMNPQILGSVTSYPQQGYNHSGWLNDNGNLYALADETHGKKLKIFDVSDPNNIIFEDTIGTETHPSLTIPHNVIFKGNILYTAYYTDGLYVFDIDDVNNIYVKGYYHTSTVGFNNSYHGAWGVYPLLPSGKILVSDIETGLWVLIGEGELSEIKENLISNKNEIKLFPNPSNQFITINSNETRINEVEIIDISGRIVYSNYNDKGFFHKVINVESFEKGNYIIRFKIGNEISSKILIKF